VQPQSSGEPIETAALVPDRVAGSVRRTSTTEVLRPEGTPGPFLLVGRARDLLTDRTGRARIVDAAELHTHVDRNGRIETLRCLPDRPECAALQGVPVRAAFRAALERALPGQCAAQSPLHALLDELPVAVMITGYALARDARTSAALRRSAVAIPVDVCAGWRSGGEIATRNAGAALPVVPLGVAAPTLLRADDPLAWHELATLPPGAMRRHRRLDLVAGPPLRADAMLRDVFVEPDGSETIVHEYRVEVDLEPGDLRVSALRATPGVLPSHDCRLSIGSAGQIPRSPIAGLRRHVSAQLKGPSTCTHLNDVFRSLSDAATLAVYLR